MNKIERIAIAATIALSPATALAHPGAHPAELGWSVAHAFAEPDHLLAMTFVGLWAAMIVAVGYWFKPWRAESWRVESWRVESWRR